MSYTAKWKILESMMREVQKKGSVTPADVLTDLRSAKLMIKISQSEESRGDSTQKLEEYLANVESYLVTEAQKVLTSDSIDEWLRRLDEASMPTCEITPEAEDKFITGVPRDLKWIRIEPMANLDSERLQQIAKETKLSAVLQKDGRLVVYGQEDDIKAFLRKMTEESRKK
jgi:hypothetical protein